MQELRKRLEEHHGNCSQALTEKDAADTASAATVSPDAPNVLQAMMQLEEAKTRAKTANRLVLEAEKEKDAAEKAVEEVKRQLHPKRARTDDDAGDAHDLLAKLDNCDLIDHRREDLDPSQVAQISWCQAVRVLIRPIGQKTSSQ